MLLTKAVTSLAICLQLMNSCPCDDCTISSYMNNYNHYEYGNIYPTVGVVYEIDTKNDLFYVKDARGDLWQFIGIEDWEINDVMSMTMADSGTAEVWDDVVLQTRYSGHINR